MVESKMKFKLVNGNRNRGIYLNGTAFESLF